MKHIILAAFVGLCLSSWAQDFPIPYNPDSDLNGLIGSPDLLSLLAVYGEEFSAAIVSEDNESAIIYNGSMHYPLCAQSCQNLPGQWEIASLESLGIVWEDVLGGGDVWLKPTEAYRVDNFYNYSLDYFNGLDIRVSGTPATNKKCYCSIRQAQRVEYDAVNINNFNEAEWGEELNQRALEGWYLVPDVGHPYVNFWRWDE